MKLKDLMVVVLLVGLIAFAMTGVVYELNSSYGSNANISVLQGYSESLGQSKNTSEQLLNTVQGGSITFGTLTGVIFSGIGTFFLIIIGFITTPVAWITSGVSALGIPIEVSIVLIGLLVVGIVFAIIYAILGREP
jgi:hypothetical protein